MKLMIYLRKKIIRHSKSPWSCPAFYVQKNAELERGVPRNVINYKPLNKVLEWIRYPIPNKQDLINRLSDSVIFSKFDLKSGFCKSKSMKMINIKLHSPPHSVIMSGL